MSCQHVCSQKLPPPPLAPEKKKLKKKSCTKTILFAKYVPFRDDSFLVSTGISWELKVIKR